MITGERIRFRAIERDDLPRFAAWLNDADVHRNLFIYQPLSLQQEEKWLEEMLKKPTDEQPLSMDIKTNDGWEHAGSISFFEINQHDRSAEIGILIGYKDLWNQGYGAEAMKLMVRHGFNDLNLNRIFLQVFETNPGGIRAYEKAGFQHEGRLREARYHEGKYIDILLMSILKEDWQKENEEK